MISRTDGDFTGGFRGGGWLEVHVCAGVLAAFDLGGVVVALGRSALGAGTDFSLGSPDAVGSGVSTRRAAGVAGSGSTFAAAGSAARTEGLAGGALPPARGKSTNNPNAITPSATPAAT